mmetsp:Transcript_27688/g.57623  ORF Transcript_27688/g.57623 Transcript_27688/m.57623 type:complete len:139 (-) Transcript_27688:28-444(-)
MTPKIVDIFFYEELSRVAGHESGSQWLLSQTTKLGCSKMSLTSTGCTSTPCRTPDQSAPTSPRGQLMCVEIISPAGHRGKVNSCQKSFSPSRQIAGVDSSMNQMIKCATSNLSACSSLKNDSSMIGLIFTDAAHSVLE